MTEPVRLGENSVAWPEQEILAINAARIAGKSNSEIRELVSQLMTRRQDVLPSALRAFPVNSVTQ